MPAAPSHAPSQLPVSRPAARWHGGKWTLAPWIIQHFPPHRAYVEPFGGGGSVLLRKPRSWAEIYNDLDAEIVNLFRVLRERGEELRRAVALTPFARVEFEESYLSAPNHDPLEQARRTLVRCFMGFGSNAHFRKTGFRCFARKSGTTPAWDWRNYPEAMTAIIARLQGVVIEQADACEVMLRHDAPDTLHYVDPPYVLDTRGSGADYRHEMDDDAHRRLAEVLNSLHGAVVLSGYRSPLYDELFEDWPRVERRTYADGARERVECLWLRNVRLEPDLFAHLAPHPKTHRI